MKDVDDVFSFLESESAIPYIGRIPSFIDEKIDEVIRAILSSSEDQRARMYSQLTERHGSMLLVFAKRMAGQAVRVRDVELIRRGVAAIAIAHPLTDSREALIALSLLHRSCEKVKMSPRDVFTSALGFADEESRGGMALLTQGATVVVGRRTHEGAAIPPV